MYMALIKIIFKIVCSDSLHSKGIKQPIPHMASQNYFRNWEVYFSLGNICQLSFIIVKENILP